MALWEKLTLRRALIVARPGKLGARGGSKYQAWIARIAQELDFIRTLEQNAAHAHPFPRQRRFAGNRAQLALLERSVYLPVGDSDWNNGGGAPGASGLICAAPTCRDFRSIDWT